METETSKRLIDTLHFGMTAGPIRVALKYFHPKHLCGNITKFHKSRRGLCRCCAEKAEGSHNECGSEGDFRFHSDDLCSRRFLVLFETQCLEHNPYNESSLKFLTNFSNAISKRSPLPLFPQDRTKASSLSFCDSTSTALPICNMLVHKSDHSRRE